MKLAIPSVALCVLSCISSWGCMTTRMSPQGSFSNSLVTGVPGSFVDADKSLFASVLSLTLLYNG